MPVNRSGIQYQQHAIRPLHSRHFAVQNIHRDAFVIRTASQTRHSRQVHQLSGTTRDLHPAQLLLHRDAWIIPDLLPKPRKPIKQR